MEEKSYQDNGALHRKPYNFFKQEVKRDIRIGEKEHIRSELMNGNGNADSKKKITICRFVGFTYNENHDRTFQACYWAPIVNSSLLSQKEIWFEEIWSFGWTFPTS